MEILVYHPKQRSATSYNSLLCEIIKLMPQKLSSFALSSFPASSVPDPTISRVLFLFQTLNAHIFAVGFRKCQEGETKAQSSFICRFTSRNPLWFVLQSVGLL